MNEEEKLTQDAFKTPVQRKMRRTWFAIRYCVAEGLILLGKRICEDAYADRLDR